MTDTDNVRNIEMGGRHERSVKLLGLPFCERPGSLSRLKREAVMLGSLSVTTCRDLWIVNRQAEYRGEVALNMTIRCGSYDLTGAVSCSGGRRHGAVTLWQVAKTVV